MNKLELRKGLMGRMDRKYCSDVKEEMISSFPSVKKFEAKFREVPLVRKEKQTRFSIGKRSK